MKEMSKTNSVFKPFAAVFGPGSILAISAVLAPIALVGCDAEEIRVYRAPKLDLAPASATQSEPVAQAPEVIWTLPSDWSQAPNEQSMRLATFRAGPQDVEVSLSAFPGDAGGILANVNRWRGQIGLDPVDEATLLEDLVSTSANGATTAIVDLNNPEGQRMLAAIVDPGDGQTWFVKAVGDTEPIGSIIDSFGAFSRSIHMDAHAGHNHGPGEHHHAPAEHDHSAEAETFEQRLASFEMPSHWAPEENASPILAASFLATNDSDGARITVTTLVGDGGGPLLNINRWRGQLGIAPVDQLDAQAGVVRESPMVVDLVAEDGSNRMLAAIIPADGATHFVKMTGSVDGAGAEMDGFDTLVAIVSGEDAGQ